MLQKENLQNYTKKVKLTVDKPYFIVYTSNIIKRERENMNKLKNGDMITDNGISYVIEMDEDGTLWGVSNNAEYEIEISEDYIPDALFSA